MSKLTKKIISFIIGGCVFLVCASLAMLLMWFIFKITGQDVTIDKDSITVGSCAVIFVFGGIMWLIVTHLCEKGMKQITKKKAIKSQMILYGIFMILTVILLVISIIKSIPALIIISTAVILSILIYEIGCFLISNLNQDDDLSNEK